MEAIKSHKQPTAADLVTGQLREAVLSLGLKPGERLSESEVSLRFGVSRQPVREAFARLEAEGLLLVRPKRATTVRGFSLERIDHARFVRLAVEIEVLRRGCAVWDARRAGALEANLEEQRRALADRRADDFHRLDYRFHELVCELSGQPSAYRTVEESKRELDRLCVFSLVDRDEFAVLVEDHERIATALRERSPDAAEAAIREHLTRLDGTITEIRKSHSAYFE